MKKLIFVIVAAGLLTGCASYTPSYTSLTNAKSKQLDEMTRKFGFMEDDAIYEAVAVKKESY